MGFDPIMLQIVSAVISLLVAGGAILSYTRLNGKIEGILITRLDELDKKMSRLEAKTDEVGALRERMAVIEYRVNEIDRAQHEVRIRMENLHGRPKGE